MVISFHWGKFEFRDQAIEFVDYKNGPDSIKPRLS